jgi:hypothetical protein
MDDHVYDEPGETKAVYGKVAMMGPEGVSVMLTPEAAVETSNRLVDRGVDANGQRVEAQRKADRRRAMFPNRE